MNKGTKIVSRMPYKVPRGAFDDMERYVLDSTVLMRRGTMWPRIVAMACGVAAALAIIFAVSLHLNSNYSFNAVQDAFAQLSSDDQAYLTEIYSDDTFLNVNY